MIENLFFQNAHLCWPVIFIGVVLWFLFVWKEWRKPLSKLFVTSCLISLLTIIAIAMLALKPKVGSLSNSVGVVLTDFYQEEQLDSLMKVEKDLKLYQYQENLSIQSKLDSLRTIYVLGDGIAPYDFWQFENRSVSYLSNEVPKGVTNINYKQINYVGEFMIVRGNYNVPQEKNSIVLEDASGKAQDSVVFEKNGSSNFVLKLPLKSKGKFVYQLVEKDSVGTILSKNNIPIHVVEKQNLQILILNDFPSFETKYLKNYLSSLGHKLVVRSQITKGRYKFEYLNTERTPIYTLNRANMQNFDLLIISSNAYRYLSKQTKKDIKNAVYLDGLGVFLQPDASLFRLSEESTNLKFQPTLNSEIVLNGFSNQTWDTYRYSFVDGPRIEKIHFNSNQIASAYKRWGNGRIGTTLIQNTFQLQLAGKQELYRDFWSEIISKISKEKTIAAKFNFSSMFPLKDEPLRFELNSSYEHPNVLQANGNLIPLKQDIDIPSKWEGVIYPLSEGWHELRLKNDSISTATMYVTDSISWTALRRHEKRLANIRLFNNKTIVADEKVQYKSINPFWFFAIALLGMGFLWLRPKLMQS